MEPLLKQLREFPEKLKNLPASTSRLIIGALGLAVVLAVLVVMFLHFSKDTWAYVYTGLSEEDGNEAATALRAAGVEVRVEGGGTAISVPSDRVYDARLILASAGLPREQGLGFEIFDRSDVGVSAFTHNVNLQRAIEGELARTIRGLDVVQDARVHVSLARRGLYRDEDREARASVVLQLHRDGSLSRRQLSGIQHLVSSAVPELKSSAVSIIDGSGSVLASGDDSGSVMDDEVQERQRRMERDLERRIHTLLSPIVGEKAVIATVSVDLDESEVLTTSKTYDPDGAVVRTQRSLLTEEMRVDGEDGGVAGAAANVPVDAQGGGRVRSRVESNTEDDSRTFDISSVVTQQTMRKPRIKRITAAVVVDRDEEDGYSAETLAHFSELVKRAVGFDAERGDEVEIGTFPMRRPAVEDEFLEPAPAPTPIPVWVFAAAGGLVLMAILFFLFMIARSRRASSRREIGSLSQGGRVAELETALGFSKEEKKVLAEADNVSADEPYQALRERARKLVQDDPSKAARLLQAWIYSESDTEDAEVRNA